MTTSRPKLEGRAVGPEVPRGRLFHARSCSVASKTRSGGYTLMELMVAMGLLVLLGGGLLTLLSQGIGIWRRCETRGRIHESARAILDAVADDLRSAMTRAREGEVVRFLADEGPAGRQRLRFVRTTPGESCDPILREGGRFLATRAEAAYDGLADAAEASAGILAAPGGSMEVMYQLDSRPGGRAIWRGYRAPPGGASSLFVDRNVQEAHAARATVERRRPATRPDSKRATESRSAARGRGASSLRGSREASVDSKVGKGARDGEGVGAASAPSGSPDEEPAAGEFYLADVAAPIASDVLYLGFRFWAPTTTTWREVPALERPRAGEESGPLDFWDSTRGILDISGAPRELSWRRIPGSLDDPSDDVFPPRVEVTVVIGEGEEVAGARLAEALADRGDALVLAEELELPTDPRDRYILIDEEWIAIQRAEGRILRVAEGGRGRRWTRAARHEAGARVELGVTFRRVVEIPCSPEAPGEATWGSTRDDLRDVGRRRGS